LLRVLFASRCTHLHALGLPNDALQALIDQQYACRRADYESRFPAAVNLIALAGEDPVGALMLHEEAAALHIVDIVVEPSARGQGHGRALVRQVQARAQARPAGRQAVTLSVDPMNQNALRLYLALGFEPTEKHPLQWRMRWHPGADLHCRAAQEGANADSLSIVSTTKG
jgi:ribosomal protein S18 acetylase RimI-like enzyme